MQTASPRHHTTGNSVEGKSNYKRNDISVPWIETAEGRIWQRRWMRLQQKYHQGVVTSSERKCVMNSKKLEMWWFLKMPNFIFLAKILFNILVRVPVGGLRKPRLLEWEKSYYIYGGRPQIKQHPICPHCKETPHSFSQCINCGQKFSKLIDSEGQTND